MLSTEPAPRLVPLAAATAVAGLTAGFAVVRGRRRLALPAVVGLLVCLGLVVASERVHWWLSEEPFDSALRESREPCRADSPCRIGWWSVHGVVADPRLPTVWVDPWGTGRCYAGQGIARPASHLSDAEVRAYALQRDGVRGQLEVNDWRGEWIELCFTT